MLYYFILYYIIFYFIILYYIILYFNILFILYLFMILYFIILYDIISYFILSFYIILNLIKLLFLFLAKRYLCPIERPSCVEFCLPLISSHKNSGCAQPVVVVWNLNGLWDVCLYKIYINF